MPAMSMTRRASVEDVEPRHAVRTGDAVPQVDREPRIARPQRAAWATVLPPHALPLRDRVHRERPCALEPDRIAVAPVQLQERIAVARRAVTQTVAFRQRARLPHRRTGG